LELQKKPENKEFAQTYLLVDRSVDISEDAGHDWKHFHINCMANPYQTAF